MVSLWMDVRNKKLGEGGAQGRYGLFRKSLFTLCLG